MRGEDLGGNFRLGKLPIFPHLGKTFLEILCRIKITFSNSGEQTRQVYCIDTKSQARVNDALCEENNATKPEVHSYPRYIRLIRFHFQTEKSCETVDCNAEWFTGEWEDCSSTCGDKGEQYRVVYCHQVIFISIV